MKKLFLILSWLLCLLPQLRGQVTVTIAISPPYPVHFEDYLKMSDFAAVTIINNTSEEQNIKLLPTVEGDNGIDGYVKTTFMPRKPLTLKPFQVLTLTGTQLRALNDNVSQDDVILRGVDQQQLIRTETLPEGGYTVCVRAHDYKTGEDLTKTPSCAFVNLTYYDPPILLQPTDKEELQGVSPQFAMFVWSPTGMSARTRYEFQLVDMTASGLFNANDAFANPAVQLYFSRKNIITNTLVYGMAEPPLQPGRTYAVRVIAYDPKNTTLFKNNGIGDVSTFTYLKPIASKPPIDKGKAEDVVAQTDSTQTIGGEQKMAAAPPAQGDQKKSAPPAKGNQGKTAPPIVAATPAAGTTGKVTGVQPTTPPVQPTTPPSATPAPGGGTTAGTTPVSGGGTTPSPGAGTSPAATVAGISQALGNAKVKGDGDNPPCFTSLDIVIDKTGDIYQFTARSTPRPTQQIPMRYTWTVEDTIRLTGVQDVLSQYRFRRNVPTNVCVEVSMLNQQGAVICTQTFCKPVSPAGDPCFSRLDFRVVENGNPTPGRYTFTADAAGLNNAALSNPRYSWTIDGQLLPPTHPAIQFNGIEVANYRFPEAGQHRVCLKMQQWSTPIAPGEPSRLLCEQEICKNINNTDRCLKATCNFASTPVPIKTTLLTTDSVELCGGFWMKPTADVSGDNLGQGFSGSGTVNVGWLRRVNVTFTNIRINGSSQVFSGDVVSVRDGGALANMQQWAVNQPITQRVVQGAQTWINQNLNWQPITSQVDGAVQQYATPAPINMPFGVEYNDNMIALLEMRFRPNGAVFDAGAAIVTDRANNETLTFAGTEIAFDNNGIYPLASGGLELTSDVQFRYRTSITQNAAGTNDTSYYKIIFYKRSPTHVGNKILWNGCERTWCYNLDMGFEFPREWLEPIVATDPPVTATLQTQICDWRDWMATVTLPRARIPNSQDTQIEFLEVTYDHSLLNNPPNIVFPVQYQGDRTVTFKGFHINRALAQLPDTWRTFADSTQPIVVAFNQIIINRTGVTGQLRATNVVNMPALNVARMGASIREFNMDWVQSSLVSASILGDIILPVANDTIVNVIAYTANYGGYGLRRDTTLHGYQFLLQPTAPITSTLFARGSITFDANSSFEFVHHKATSPTTRHPGQQYTRADMKLNGELNYPFGVVQNPLNGAQIPLDLNAKFEGLNMWVEHIRDNGTTTADFEIGTWAFASPQKFFAKIPVTITNFKKESLPLVQTPGQMRQVFRGKVKIDVLVNFHQNKIAGSTTLALIGNLRYGGGTRIRPQYEEFKVEKIMLKADMPAVKMNGEVAFYNNDAVWGNGFAGNITAEFKAIKMSVRAASRFGCKTDAPPLAPYRYWNVEALATIPPPGIPFVTGLAFRGFGAAAWYHLAADASQVTVNVNSANTQNPVSGIRFTPDRNAGFGFAAKTVIAGNAEESFNGDMGISGAFATTGGMTFLRFDGSFFVGAKIANRQKALINGNVSVNYDFPNKLFDLQAQANINQPPVTTPSPLQLRLFVNGRTGRWYFKCGEPSNLNTIRVALPPLAAFSTSSYFMFGNDIPAPPTFLPQTISGYLAATGQPMNFVLDPTQVQNAATFSGQGIAFGAALRIDSGEQERSVSGEIAGCEWEAGINYRFIGGLELNASLLRYPGLACGSHNPAGWGDGWRISANAAAYASAQVGAYGRSCLICRNRCEIDIADLRFGAYVVSQFPNPFYVAGEVRASAELFGRVNVRFNADFEIGSRCNGTPATTGGIVYTQEDATELGTELIQTLSAPANGAVNVAQENLSMRAVYTFTPDEAFTVSEMQADGTSRSRTFRVRYEPRMQFAAGAPYNIRLGTGTVTAAPIINANTGEYAYSAAPVFPTMPCNTQVTFVVTARMEEQLNGQWVAATTRATNTPITEVKSVQFTTRACPPPTPPTPNGGSINQQTVTPMQSPAGLQPAPGSRQNTGTPANQQSNNAIQQPR